MSIQSVFTEKFEVAINAAYKGGAKAAPLAGIGLALGSSLTYVAEGMSSAYLLSHRVLNLISRSFDVLRWCIAHHQRKIYFRKNGGSLHPHYFLDHFLCTNHDLS